MFYYDREKVEGRGGKGERKKKGQNQKGMIIGRTRNGYREGKTKTCLGFGAMQMTTHSPLFGKS